MTDPLFLLYFFSLRVSGTRAEKSISQGYQEPGLQTPKALRPVPVPASFPAQVGLADDRPSISSWLLRALESIFKGYQVPRLKTPKTLRPVLMSASFPAQVGLAAAVLRAWKAAASREAELKAKVLTMVWRSEQTVKAQTMDAWREWIG